jgi:hypothetical protein
VGKLRDHRSTADRNRALLAGWQAPDLLGIGVIVCHASGQLVIANQTAQDILHARDGLQLSADGRLCESQEGAQELADIVRQRAAQLSWVHRDASDCASIVVHRTSGKAPLTLLVRSFCPPSIANPEQSLALVLVLDSSLAGKADGIGLPRLPNDFEEYRSGADWGAKASSRGERLS